VAAAVDSTQNSVYASQWHHFAGTCDQDTVRLYVDGILAASVPNPADNMRHTPVDLIIGNGVESELEAFKGMIDEVRVWNLVRTEQELRETMHRKLTGTEPGLVGYWDFDAGEGQVVEDLSSSANHGYLGSTQNTDAADPVWVLSDAPVGICPDDEPQLENTYHVDATYGNDDNDGLTRHAAFATIQHAIDVAEEGWTILVWPGVYDEEIHFMGKAITLQGRPGAVIDSTGGFGVSFTSGEGPDSVASNLTLKNNYMAVFCAGSSPTLRNLTIVGNRNGVSAFAGAAPAVVSCIVWGNTDDDLVGCGARYSCVEDGAAGDGNISEDPVFANPQAGDCHLRSRIGRYDASTDTWVVDNTTSPCIDAGDPETDPTKEPMPSGGRINMGAYGGTSEASKSPNPWPNAADLDYDGNVNLADLALMAEQWLWHAPWRN